MMVNQLFDVSVVIPTFNSERFIQEAIESVLSQTKVSVELIIVDAGSSDNTINILNRYTLSNPNVRVLHNVDDMGPAHARSVGVNASRGKYIAFLDSDDVWVPHKLESQLKVMKEQGWNFTYCLYGSDPTIADCFYSALKEYTYWKAIFLRGIATFTVVIKRDVLTAEVMQFYPNQYAEDYLWWLLLINNGVVPRLVPICGGYYRKHENARSVNLIQNLRSINFYLSNILKLPAPIRLFVFIVYPLDVFFRKLKYRCCIFLHNLLDVR